MPVLCLGLSHHTASVELRERLNYPPAALKAALARFGCGRDSRPAGVLGLTILSTCNRLELYAQAAEGGGPGGGRALFAPLVEFLAETRGLPAAQFESHLYRRRGSEAVEHLCRVASGLDSMVLGEPQILGQVAEAHEAAARAGAAGPVLSALFRTAIRAGKRARTETAIGRNPASITSVAVRLAEQVLGDLARRRVLVVGAGQIGELAVEALRLRGVRQVLVANRTRERAAALAERWGGQALSFEQLAEGIRLADIVIASTGAPHTIISPALVQQALAGRIDRPLVVIDVAVPRDVEPAVGELSGVRLFDIDHLQDYLEGAAAGRESEIPRVEAIVAEEVEAFAFWLRAGDVVPLISELRSKAEGIRRRELDRTFHYLPELDAKTRSRIEHLSEALVNKLLHEPTLCLRREATNGHAADFAQAVRHLFALGGARPAGPEGQD